MPSLQDLERFRDSFRSVGGESTILASRGESIDELPLPSSQNDDESDTFSSDAFSIDEPDFDSSEPADELPVQDEDPAAMDFGDFLDTIPDDLSSESLPETSLEDDFTIPDGLLVSDESVDSDSFAVEELGSSLGEEESFSLFAEEAPEPSPKDKKKSSAKAVEEKPAFDFASELAALENLDTGNEDEEELEKLEDEVLEDQASQDQVLEGEVLEENPEEIVESFDDFDLGDGSDFNLSEPEPPLAASDDDFSIPDFDATESTSSLDDELADLGGEEQLDSFDTFSLDDEFMASDFGVRNGALAGGSPEESSVHLDDFSLEGIDDVFRAPAAPVREAPPPRRPRGRGSAASGDIEEIVLSEEDLKNLEATLDAYPLNLRVACEELIVEHAVPPDQMAALVKSLVRGAPAREMAALASRLIGKTIVIPRGFEKKSGAELEAERATFAYAFVHNILPVLRIFTFVAVVVTSLVYLGFEFIYTPLRAEHFYKQGYERIAAEEYARANERFDQGFMLRRVKGWFYKYAEAFADKRQYLLAEQKYDQLLKLYPHDKKGALDYAAMETKQLRNYQKADRIIRTEILDFKVDDKEGLLALGDNNLAWAEIEYDRYEEARSAYAKLMEKYGRQDPYLERMLLYFMRTDKLSEVLPLQEYFLESNRRKISGPSLAELGGYLLDKKEMEPKGVPDPNIAKIERLRDVLDKAIQADPQHPESYYHLARYFNRYGKPIEEKSAISKAIRAFDAAPEQSARRAGYRIDAHRKFAALLKNNKEYLSATEQLVKGISLYEDDLQRRILRPSPQFGRLYADLGDLEYFVAGNLDVALAEYTQAVKNGWAPPELRYRMGYVHYVSGDWGKAVESFFDASSDLPLNRRILFSLGNALYSRGDLHAAQGYYNRLLDMLEAERARFPTLLPNERPEHAELAERLMRARNNLGVVLQALADSTGNVGYRSRALSLYSESARAWDALTRDPSSMVRSQSTNLAFLNTKGSLYPLRTYESQIYVEIDKDVQEPSDWEELLAR